MGSIPTLGTKPILQNVQAQERFEQNRFTVVRWLRYSRDDTERALDTTELRQPKPLLREMLEERFESEHHRKFRANRSLRDVEPEVNLYLHDLRASRPPEGA